MKPLLIIVPIVNNITTASNDVEINVIFWK